MLMMLVLGSVALWPCVASAQERGTGWVLAMEPEIDNAGYRAACVRTDSVRAALTRDFLTSRTPDLRARMLERVGIAFVKQIYGTLLPPWYGTPWAFYGTTQVPGQGTIACGYLVSTVLRDAGLRVERCRLAQQASEKIVTTLVQPQFVRRASDEPLDSFVAHVRRWGDGLYVVGLDCHVGFIVCVAGSVRFVHSTYVSPSNVMDENAAESAVLSWSRYRVLGKLSADPRCMEAWLRGWPLRVKGTPRPSPQQ